MSWPASSWRSPRARLGGAARRSVVDYADKLDEVARHHPPARGAARLLPLLPRVDPLQIAPFAVLLGDPRRSWTALQEQRRHRLQGLRGFALRGWRLPSLVLVGLGTSRSSRSASTFCRSPSSGRPAIATSSTAGPPDYGIRTSAERNWYLDRDGRIWFREESVPARNALLGVSIFHFDADFPLRGPRPTARSGLGRRDLDARGTAGRGPSTGAVPPTSGSTRIASAGIRPRPSWRAAAGPRKCVSASSSA